MRSLEVKTAQWYRCPNCYNYSIQPMECCGEMMIEEKEEEEDDFETDNAYIIAYPR